MALNKEIIQENGIQANYHKISRIALTIDEQGIANLLIVVDSFLNKEYREKNRPIFSDCYSLTLASGEDASIGIRSLGYQKLKELDNFIGSEDC